MADQDRIPKIGHVLGGKYALESVLGQGGMGIVLAARNVRTGKRVAIKWLLPRLRDDATAHKRFEREARLAGRIEHPNVVDVYDVEREGEATYLVMELLEGQSLAHRIASGRPMPLFEAAAIFMPVLRGVAAAHAAGIVHRDLKPDNVFLCRPRDGSAEVPKVLDFGISKLAERDDSVTTVTQDGTLLGTIQCMSPEQLRGQPTDERTDVFALGVMLYRMLSAELPYRGSNAIDLALNIASNTPAPLSDRFGRLPPELDAVLARALARDASERFRNVEDFAHALEPYFGGHTFRPDDGAAVARTGPAGGAGGVRVASNLEVTPFSADDRDSRTQVTAPRARMRAAAVATAVVGALVVGLVALASWRHWSARPDVLDAKLEQERGASEPDPARTSQEPAAIPAAPRAATTRPARTDGGWIARDAIEASAPPAAAAAKVAHDTARTTPPDEPSRTAPIAAPTSPRAPEPARSRPTGNKRKPRGDSGKSKATAESSDEPAWMQL